MQALRAVFRKKFVREAIENFTESVIMEKEDK